MRSLSIFVCVLAAAFASELACSTGARAVPSGPRATVSTLSNGVTLIVSEQRAVPMVQVRVLIDAGSRRDAPGKEGLANLTADLLTEGTATRGAATISETIDFVGGALESSAATDYAEVSLRVLSRDLDLGLELLADVLLHPAFAAAELGRRRDAVLASIRSAEDDPSATAEKAFKRALFGDGPYGHPTEGTEKAVRLLSVPDVRNFYRRHYRPSSAAVVVVGDVGEGEVRSRLEAMLGGWTGGSPQDLRPAPPDEGMAKEIRIERPVTQASIVLGHLGVARDAADFEAISVMNYILGGGGFSSRLTASIRIEAGLAYSVASFFSSNKAPGSFQVVMQTKNASVADAIVRARLEIERIRNEPVTEGELDDAKRYLIGSFPLRLDSVSEIASFLSQTWFYGLGIDYAETYAKRVEAVSRDDVLRVARRHLHAERLIEVVVTDRGGGAPSAEGSEPTVQGQPNGG